MGTVADDCLLLWVFVWGESASCYEISLLTIANGIFLQAVISS